MVRHENLSFLSESLRSTFFTASSTVFLSFLFFLFFTRCRRSTSIVFNGLLRLSMSQAHNYCVPKKLYITFTNSLNQYACRELFTWLIAPFFSLSLRTISFFFFFLSLQVAIQLWTLHTTRLHKNYYLYISFFLFARSKTNT